MVCNKEVVVEYLILLLDYTCLIYALVGLTNLLNAL